MLYLIKKLKQSRKMSWTTLFAALVVFLEFLVTRVVILRHYVDYVD